MVTSTKRIDQQCVMLPQLKKKSIDNPKYDRQSVDAEFGFQLKVEVGFSMSEEMK